MAKRTYFFIFFLSILSVFLLGINLGKKIEKGQKATPTILPTQPISSPTFTPSVSPTLPISESEKSGLIIYEDKTCGFRFSYPGSFLKQKTANDQSYLFADPKNPDAYIATTCANNIPKPSISPDKIEKITLDKVEGTLYHDQSPDGSPRNEAIIRHPTNGKEIIIAGYGPYFQNALSSFKFL